MIEKSLSPAEQFEAQKKLAQVCSAAGVSVREMRERVQRHEMKRGSIPLSSSIPYRARVAGAWAAWCVLNYHVQRTQIPPETLNS